MEAHPVEVYLQPSAESVKVRRSSSLLIALANRASQRWDVDGSASPSQGHSQVRSCLVGTSTELQTRCKM